jgi:hypothetical protein
MKRFCIFLVIILTLILSGCSISFLTYEGQRYYLNDGISTYEHDGDEIYVESFALYTRYRFSFTDTFVDHIKGTKIYNVNYPGGLVYRCEENVCTKTEGSGIATEDPSGFKTLFVTSQPSGNTFGKAFLIIVGILMMVFGVPFAVSRENAIGLFRFRTSISLMYKDAEPSEFGIIVTRISAGIVALLGISAIIIALFIGLNG